MLNIIGEICKENEKKVLKEGRVPYRYFHILIDKHKSHKQYGMEVKICHI